VQLRGINEDENKAVAVGPMRSGCRWAGMWSERMSVSVASSDVRNLVGGLWRSDRRAAWWLLCVICVVPIGALLLAATTQAQPATTERVSLSTSGEEANDLSSKAYLSADGRYVAFESWASNLVPGDGNGYCDVFVRDRLLATTERASVSSAGEEGSVGSFSPSISADGRFVAFESYSYNLVDGDTNTKQDVFVRDLQLGTTERVSVSSSGAQSNGYSRAGSISADGRFVAFDSHGSNLVPGDTNATDDVFLRDRLLGRTERISLSSSGEQGDDESRGASVNADGRFVAFESYASNLVPGDTSRTLDLFVRDRLMRTTERVNVSTMGEEPNNYSYPVSLSADGRFAVFSSLASNLVPDDTNGTWDVFVRDRQLKTTERVSVSSLGEQANEGCSGGSLSADGRLVAFSSWASNLVPDDTNRWWDVFVRDRELGTTERVSLSNSGAQGNGSSEEPSISDDGRLVAFSSYADNLVPDDTNKFQDVFLRDRQIPYNDVSGTVTFQHLDPLALPPSAVTMRVTWNGSPLDSCNVELGPDGSYSLSLPAGSLILSIKHTHWLRRTVPVDNSAGPVSGIDFPLVNGDAIADNRVDLADLTHVLVRFGAADPMADLDGGGVVDLPDLSVTLLNWRLVGDE
jgi:Tol biopolymer transport system component